MRWTCPACEREFGRANQSHDCIPGCTVDESLARLPAEQRAAYDAVVNHLRVLGEIHEDAVNVGVFLKSDRKFAEARPMSRWLSLWVFLPRIIEDERVTRLMTGPAGRHVHVLRLYDPEDVDGTVRDWLSEALAAADHQPPGV